MSRFKPFCLMTTDLHLDDNPDNEYRFEIFKWLLQEQYVEGVTKVLIIAGDLTDKKDNHSSKLLNKIVRLLKMMSDKVLVIILRGNHDCIDPQFPFFEFLGHIPNIVYVSTPRKLFPEFNGRQFRLAMAPHSRNPEIAWKGFEFVKSDAIFLHQTFRGALTENGTELDGLSPARFDRYKAKAFSGDIHVPQIVGKITYIGAPYHVRFGDQFTPRVLLADENFNTKDVYFPAPRKHSVTIRKASELKTIEDLSEGDWIKVKVQMPRLEFEDWPLQRDRVRRVCEKLRLDLHGVSLCELKVGGEKGKTAVTKKARSLAKPEHVLEHYCKAKKVDVFTKKIGRALLKNEPEQGGE